MNIVCKICKQEKDCDSFYKRNKNSYRNECKTCFKLNVSNYYKKNFAKIVAYKVNYKKKNHKKILDKAKEYNSRPDVVFKQKQYRKNNKKILRLKEKIWRLKNPEKAKIIARRKHLKRIQNPIVKIRYNVSRAVNLALKKNMSSKCGESTFKYLPYTIQELRQHLEKLFESWMTWNNYGKYNSKTWIDNDQSTWTWNIDHIVCQADLQFDSLQHENFQKCWALENLRPYSAKQNILDGANRIRNAN